MPDEEAGASPGLSRRLALAIPMAAAFVGRPRLGRAQPTPPDTDWLHYAADLASTRSSTLDQIDAGNFGRLEIAWRLKGDNFGPRREAVFEATPLVAKGVLYTTIGSRRDVAALDAATGEILWVHREDEGERAAKAPRSLSGRGLSYWTDGVEARILYVTIGYRLVALDARSGAPVSGFGDGGVVDLKTDFDQPIDPLADVGLQSTPCVAKDVVIIGAAHSPGFIPRKRTNVKGYVRAFDVRTGKRLWTFHTIPQKGEPGHETWVDGTETVGNGGVWCQVSVDAEANLVYLGVELPTGDVIGTSRRGAGLYGESIVAVDLHTGERRWHYQTVHHGLWDYDIACAPILCDVPIGARIVKALALPSKQGFLYVLDRLTGEPVWSIPERRVPKGDVPGEWYAPTQPHPSKPPPYAKQGVAEGDLIDFTPALRAEALKLAANYRMGPLFTPPTVFKAEGSWGTLSAPHILGGSNWPGGAYDAETHRVFVYAKNEAYAFMAIANADTARSEFDYIAMGAPRIERDGFRPGVLTVQGLPLLKPPYGALTAVDMRRGEIAWATPHGATPDAVREHPALKGLDIPRTGQAGMLGPLVSGGLVICGDAESTTGPQGKAAMLRAYDKRTGQEVGAVALPAPQTGVPMTYRLRGRQYIVIAVGAPGFGSELVALRQPA